MLFGRLSLIFIVGVFAGSLNATDAEAARGRKLEFDSEFARSVYEDNTCAIIKGQLVYPAVDFALGRLLRNWPNELTDPGIQPCDSPSALHDTVTVVTDEVLLGRSTAFLVSVAGEPCLAEPTIVLHGDVRDLYVDVSSQMNLVMRLVAAGLTKHCGQEPRAMQVRIRDREVQPDPAQPATRKQPAGTMVVRTESYAGRYIPPPPDSREGQWQDADPAAREAYLAALRTGQRYTAEGRRIEANLYEMEHREEIAEDIRRFLGAAANSESYRFCAEIVRGPNARGVTLSQEQWANCLRILAEQ